MPTKARKTSPAKHTSSFQKKNGKTSSKRAGFPIVGIGASAGGLETLEALFSRMPPEASMAFVIIQHLSPNFKSIMASLLAKYTRMTVSEIEDGTTLAPNCVYLNPPKKNVAVFNRTLHLMEPIKSGAINMPIDFFFRSLSEDQKENAIGIIVSRTASDVTLGVKAIKGEGGMVMVQNPDTAKYDGMPRSAIRTGLVDFILPVGRISKTLFNYVKHPLLKSPGKINVAETTIQHQLRKVFALIRTATGHDFSQYKQTTIRRRIERRLVVHQIDKLTDYLIYMQKNPLEIDALFKDLVIGVTSFFRDPEAYQVLEQKVIPKLLHGRKRDDPLRCWVVGCSTGEEAYSLAVIEKAILSQYAPTGVLIDARYEIMHFVGPMDKFLVPPAGKPSFNILKMVREDLKFRLTATLLTDESGRPIEIATTERDLAWLPA